MGFACADLVPRLRHRATVGLGVVGYRDALDMVAKHSRLIDRFGIYAQLSGFRYGDGRFPLRFFPNCPIREIR